MYSTPFIEVLDIRILVFFEHKLSLFRVEVHNLLHKTLKVVDQAVVTGDTKPLRYALSIATLIFIIGTPLC